MAGVKPPPQRAPRRRWPVAEKRRIVELTLRKGASIRAIAREQDVHPTSLCHWRTLYRAGKLDAQSPAALRVRTRTSSAAFLPVMITPASGMPQLARDSHAGCPSVVQITLPFGTTLRIETGALDAEFLCALIAQVQR